MSPLEKNEHCTRPGREANKFPSAAWSLTHLRSFRPLDQDPSFWTKTLGVLPTLPIQVTAAVYFTLPSQLLLTFFLKLLTFSKVRVSILI
jgi:hypothetical protein